MDGWAKGRDPNTAFSATWSFGPGEHFPNDAVHGAYRREYNARPALRLVRPLTRDYRRARAIVSRKVSHTSAICWSVNALKNGSAKVRADT